MIIKGGSRSKWRFFARHLTNVKENEHVRVIEITGVSADNVLGAFREMDAVASGTQCTNFMYHADLNPRENERLTEEQWKAAADTLERHLGLQGQPRVIVEHEKEGRCHRHVVWSRIDADTMTARPDSLTYRKHEAAAREIEKDCELQPVASVLVKDREGPRPARRSKDFEGFRGVQTGLNPEQVTREVSGLWRECDTGAAFHSRLKESGYILCQGDRVPFCIVDPAGKEHSLTRRVEDAKAAEIYARLKDIDRAALPTVEEARELATAWGGNSDAARAVRNKLIDDRLKSVHGDVPLDVPQWDVERMNKLEFEYEPGWSTLEQAAHEYGGTVKEVARGLHDAYWQAVEGGKPKTEAERLHDLMWGDRVKNRDAWDWER